jgi:MFS family permease
MTTTKPRARPPGPRATAGAATAVATKSSPTRGPAAPALAIYYALLVTQTISQIGSQISEYAVGIAVFHATGHATPLALVLLFQTAPYLLGGFFGALADRFDRRSVMLVANLGFTATSGLLLASFASGAFQLWHLYALTLGAALFGALARPAFQASVAMLAADSHRDRANAIGQMTGPAAGVIAAALAGMLYALVGVTGAITIDLATFILAIAMLAVVRIPRPAETAQGRAMQATLWRQVFDGFRFLAARPVLLGFCSYVAVVNLFANTAMAVLTPYVLARTGSATLFGVVLAMMNGGAIVGALLISARLVLASRMNTVMLGIVGGGVSICLAGVSQNAVTIGLSLFAMGLTLAFANAPYFSMLQAKVAPDLQGRVFATLFQAGMLLSPIAFLAAGPLADRVFEPARAEPVWRSVGWLVGAGPGAGMGLLFVITGAAVTAISLGVYAIPAVRRLEADLPDHGAEGPGPAPEPPVPVSRPEL